MDMKQAGFSVVSPGSKLPVPGGPDVIMKDPLGGCGGPGSERGWGRRQSGREKPPAQDEDGPRIAASGSWERRKRTLPSASGRSQVMGAFQTALWVVGLSNG